MRKEETAHAFPPPPRFLLVGFALLAILSFLGGFVMHHHLKLPVAKGKTKVKAAAKARAPVKAKAQTPATAQGGVFTLVAQNRAGAGIIQAELKKEGYQSTIQEVHVQAQTESGFSVAQDLDPTAAKPVADTLSDVYHLPVTLITLSQYRTRVQVGSVYKSEAEAKRIQAKLQHLGFNWQIFSGTSKITVAAYQVEARNVPAGKMKELEKTISKKGVKTIQ